MHDLLTEALQSNANQGLNIFALYDWFQNNAPEFIHSLH